MVRGPPVIAPLGSSVVLYVGPPRCGWRGRGVARRPAVGLVLVGEPGGLGVVIHVVLADG